MEFILLLFVACSLGESSAGAECLSGCPEALSVWGKDEGRALSIHRQSYAEPLVLVQMVLRCYTIKRSL